MSRSFTVRCGEKPEQCSGLLRNCVLAVVMLAGLAVPSQSAFGSCGDYLYSKGKPVGHHFVSPPGVGYSLTVLPFANPEPDLPVHRCHGPKCSGSPLPAAPVPTAPSTLNRGLDPAAVLAEFCQTSGTGQGAMCIPESERGACYQPSTIFRPPAA